MGAHPKQRISQARQGNRRRYHFLALPQLMSCPMCGAKKRTHYVCPNCGTYKGREVINMDRAMRRARERQIEQ